MEFTEQYLTYKEYQGLGGQLPEMPFNLLEYNARKEIDKRTFGRLVNQTIPNEVKLCEYELIKVLDNYNSMTTQNKGVKSENIDGYSVSYYGIENNLTNAKNGEIKDIINTYLSNTIVDDIPVLYIGV